jgi:hypothetical protein
MMAADALYRESQSTVTESCVLLELGSNGFLRRFCFAPRMIWFASLKPPLREREDVVIH